ncbi:MAG TPA: DUF3467 domain-containing protein [Spirochaetota bacterium]
MRENEMNVEVKVDDKIAEGVFSNFANITHSPEEFIVDFLFINPAPPSGFGKLMSRVVMTPGHMKRLCAAMQDNIARYEERFGEIKNIGQSGSDAVSVQ